MAEDHTGSTKTEVALLKDASAKVAKTLSDHEGRISRLENKVIVAATVATWARAHPLETVPPEAFIGAIEAAVQRAGEQRAGVDPYGCFVTPEASRG